MCVLKLLVVMDLSFSSAMSCDSPVWLRPEGSLCFVSPGERGALPHALPKRAGPAVGQPSHERLHLPGETPETPKLGLAHILLEKHLPCLTADALHFTILCR